MGSIPWHERKPIPPYTVTCECGASYTLGDDMLRPVDTGHTHDDGMEYMWYSHGFWPRDAEDDRANWSRVMRGERASWATEWTVESPNYRKGN